MRFALVFAGLIFSAVSFAKTVKIKGQDAQNICATFRNIYALQHGALVTYPLAQVVRRNIMSTTEFEFSLGNADESIICQTSVDQIPVVSQDGDLVRVIYNEEVSSFSSDRVISSWQMNKAYNIQGALAETVCTQLETLNIAEDQAQLSFAEEVIHLAGSASVDNIFGLVASFSSGKYMHCGVSGEQTTLQFQPVRSW